MKLGNRQILLSIGILLITLFLGNDILGAQRSPVVDSLFNELKQSHSDSVQAKIYFKIAWKSFYSDLELSKTCTDSALHISKSRNNQYDIASCFHYYGLYHRFKGEPEKAIESFETALKHFPAEADSMNISGTIFNLGVMSYQAGRYEEAIAYYLRDLKINEANKRMDAVCQSYNSIGLVFKKLRQTEKAEEYLLKSLSCGEEIEDTIVLSLTTGNLVSFYLEQQQFDKAEQYGKQALRFAQSTQESSKISFANYLLAGLDYETGKYADAESKLKETIRLLEGDFRANNYADANILYGYVCLKTNRAKQAIKHFNTAQETAKKSNYNFLLIDINKGLSKAHEALGNEKQALDFYKKQIAIKDSLLDVEKLELVNDLELKYDAAKKDVQLKEQELTIEKQENKRKLMLSGLLGLAFLSGAIFLFMRNRLKAKAVIASQKEELHKQTVNRLEKEKKILVMSSMLEGQEVERMRIAKDLHDGLGGLLSTVRARLSKINEEVSKIESYNIYEKTTSMVDDACEEVRRISHNLLPGALRLDGLKTALKILAEELDEAHPFNVNLEIIGFENKLDETKEVFLYRIVQEATNNIIKYAEAKNVLIQLSESDEEYHLTIEDDGKGFEASSIDSNYGLGLKSIRSRVEHLGGELDIISKLGEGVSIAIHLPKTSTDV